MGISVAEREELLAEPLVGALSVHAGDGRAPLTVPVWFEYVDGRLWFHSNRDAVKLRLLEAAGRGTLMVNRTRPTVRYVSAEGPVTIEEVGPDDVARMARRYLAGESLDRYLEHAVPQLGPQAKVVITPERWLGAELGAF